MTDRGRPLGVRHAKSAAAHAALDAGTASTNPVTSAGAATSLDVRKGPTVFTGRLRLAGDGYEYVDFYVDDALLADLLENALPHVAYPNHYWVIEPGTEGRESWQPYPEDQLAAQQAALLDGREPPAYVPRLALGLDWGRVRITVESLDDNEA